MYRNIFQTTKIASLAIAMTALISCNKEDNNSNTPAPTPPSGQVEENFNVIYRVGHERNSDWAILPLSQEKMTSGKINFQSNGFVLPQTRTQQMYATDNGKKVFVYDAGTKKITKYEVTGGTDFYKKVAEISVEPILGNAGGTWKVMDNRTALIFGVFTNHIKNDQGTYQRTEVTLIVGSIDLESFTANVRETKRYTLETQAEETGKFSYINNLGHPIVANGKVYFGTTRAKYNTTTGKNEKNYTYNATTLVLDYPSLNNLTLIKNTTVNGATASPSSYYGLSYVNDGNSVYHVIPVNTGKIVKITSGAYDTSYDFDVKTALGLTEDINISGFFYVGNGIGYINYAPSATARGYENGAWSVARVDLNNKTAIKMNVPEKLWLNFYQTAKVYNGKLYMPLCPIDANGNVYIFDPTKAEANGFVKGAELEVAGGALYLGVF